jgi:glutaredoxin
VTNDTAKLMEIVQVSGMRTVPQIFNGEVTSENLL